MAGTLVQYEDSKHRRSSARRWNNLKACVGQLCRATLASIAGEQLTFTAEAPFPSSLMPSPCLNHSSYPSPDCCSIQEHGSCGLSLTCLVISFLHFKGKARSCTRDTHHPTSICPLRLAEEGCHGASPPVSPAAGHRWDLPSAMLSFLHLS